MPRAAAHSHFMNRDRFVQGHHQEDEGERTPVESKAWRICGADMATEEQQERGERHHQALAPRGQAMLGVEGDVTQILQDCCRPDQRLNELAQNAERNRR
jgi:hypothetical protein